MKNSAPAWAAFTFTAVAAASTIVMKGNVPCRVEHTTYKGWQAVQLTNPWVKLFVVPKLGGRLMQVNFGGHDFLFVNPRYAGQYFPPSEGAAKGKWFNYGGDKIWPLPEGEQDERHWAGGSDVLDDGEYTASEHAPGEPCGVTLLGPPDARTGLQITRTVSIDHDTPRIRFHAVMKNVTGHSVEWSIQSVTQYDTADPRNPARYNNAFRAITPINSQSAYLDSYHVRFGPAENPAFKLRDGRLFDLQYMFVGTEVWLDSPAGWLAVLDSATGFAMVERTEYQHSRSYPGKASTIFYMNGPSMSFDALGMPALTSASPDDTPYYLEAELNSPLVRLAPGDTFPLDTEWFPTRFPLSSLRANNVTEAGIVTENLAARPAEGGVLRLSGSFGVLWPGALVAHLYGSHGTHVGTVPLGPVNPLQPVSLDRNVPAARVAWISLHVEDQQRVDRGSLGEVSLAPTEEGP